MDKRKLATIRKVDSLEHIDGADFIEMVRIDGWQCVAKKGEFKSSDLCVYFEVDSFLPVEERYDFLKKSSYKKVQDPLPISGPSTGIQTVCRLSMKSQYLFEPPTKIPFEKLRYELTPSLVSNLTWAHRGGGKLSAMRFSHYGHKRLENKALTRRIAHMVSRAGTNVGLDDVKNVLAGNLLPPRRHAAQTIIRRVAVIQEGVRQFARSGDVTTPEIFHTCLNFINSGDPLWSRFIGAKKEKMLEIQRGSVSVTRDVAKLYEWVNDDELIEHEPILRAATLYWGLFCLHQSGTEKPALEAALDHELRAGGIDNHGLLVLPDTDPGFEVLDHYDIFSIKAYETGDLTQRWKR
jgi:hypothetical protein